MRPTLDKSCRPFKHGMAPTLVRASPMLALTGWTGRSGRQALIGRIWGTDREQHGGHGLLGSWEVDAAWKGKEGKAWDWKGKIRTQIIRRKKKMNKK